MTLNIMNIEMTDKEYCYVNSEIVNIYGESWNHKKYGDKKKIVDDILLYA